jgi:hypothetical protein
MGTEESGGAGDEGDHYSAKIRKLVPPNPRADNFWENSPTQRQGRLARSGEADHGARMRFDVHRNDRISHRTKEKPHRTGGRKESRKAA